MFYWGAASSSHQVEGNTENDWTEFEKKRGLEESGRATDHYNRFREDFDLAREIGHNAHRFSIEWSRIEPVEGEWDEKEIEHYREVISNLKARKIEPFITLWHWPVPIWFRDKGGWEWSGAPKAFERFVEKIVSEYPHVKFWITLNEPNINSMNGYLKGKWPPGKHNLFSYFRVNKNLIQAHKNAYRKIKKNNSASQVGIAQNIVYFEAARNIFINRFLQWFPDTFWNWYVLNRIRRFQDFIGINYYFHHRIDWGFNKNKNEEVSDLGWEIYPHGLYEVLITATRMYKKPIYILENGIADAEDHKRARFIRDHVAQTKKALRHGVDVRGYFYWSLTDNFEWSHGFGPRFGLIEIDYDTMQRRIRGSALVYKEIIERTHIPERNSET